MEFSWRKREAVAANLKPPGLVEIDKTSRKVREEKKVKDKSIQRKMKPNRQRKITVEALRSKKKPIKKQKPKPRVRRPEWNSDTKATGSLFSSEKKKPIAVSRRLRRPSPPPSVRHRSPYGVIATKRTVSKKAVEKTRKTNQEDSEQPSKSTMERDELYWAFTSQDELRRGYLRTHQVLKALEKLGLSADFDQVEDFANVVNNGVSDTLEFDDFVTLVNALRCMAGGNSEDSDDEELNTHPMPSKRPNQSPERHIHHASRAIAPPKDKFEMIRRKPVVVAHPNETGPMKIQRQTEYVKENADQLTEMLLSNMLDDTIYLLQSEENRIWTPTGNQLEQLNSALLVLEKMERENDRVRKLLDKSSLDIRDCVVLTSPESLTSSCTKAVVAQETRRPKTMHPSLAESIEEQRERYCKHRRFMEASLVDTGFQQSDVIELLEDSILDDTMQSCALELESIFDSYASKLFQTV